MREQSNLSTYCFAKDSTDSHECFLFTPCPKVTNASHCWGATCMMK